MLTESMRKALSRISEMPAKEQNALADMILSDEEDNKGWDARFENSQGLDTGEPVVPFEGGSTTIFLWKEPFWVDKPAKS